MADPVTPAGGGGPERAPTATGRSNRLLVVALSGVAFSMGALSFAAVPLYDLFCRVTGWGGTPQVASAMAAEDAVLDRTMRVRFTARSGQGLPWRFTAETNEMTVRVGEPVLVYFEAENRSDAPVAGQAVYNVAPDRAGAYFVKVECFCFEEQILDPGETVEFPVYFYLDPALDRDIAFDDVRVVTLSYTFYPQTSDALDEHVARWREAADAPADSSAHGGRSDT